MKDNQYYASLGNNIIEMLLGCDGAVRYEPERLIEVKPGRESPMHVNFKNTLSDVIFREKIADSLAHAMRSNGVDYICGVESGGSYFASRCADILGTPVSLFRKSYKEYAEKGFLVGPDPGSDSIVAVLDDTLVTGTTISPVVTHLKNLSSTVHVHCILSYGLDAQVKRWLEPESITSIFNINDLIEIGVAKGKFSLEAQDFIQHFLSKHSEGV